MPVSTGVEHQVHPPPGSRSARVVARSGGAGPAALSGFDVGDRDGAHPGGDGPRDEYLDAACRAAARLFATPFVGVSVPGRSSRWYVDCAGAAFEGVLPDLGTPPWRGHGEGLVVLDTRDDPRFVDEPFVTGRPRLRFYAGVPLAAGEEGAGATLSIADVRPRPDFGAEQLRRLRDVAVFVEAHLRLASTLEDHAREAELLAVTLDRMNQGLVVTDADDRIRVHDRRVVDLIDVPPTLLADGAPFEAVRAFQATRGESADRPDAARRRSEADDPGHLVPIHESEGPNGKVVEVRTMPTCGGGTVRTYTDVTARRAAERALLDGERRYRLIAENASDVIVLYDLDLRRLYVSPAATAILGRAPRDLVGGLPMDIVHPEDVGPYLRICDEVRRGQVGRALTTQRHLHGDGRWIWMEVSLALTRAAADGRPDGFVATLRDVSDRKAAEDALRASEARLRVSEERLALALDSGDDGVFDVDLETGTNWTSRRWLRRLGFEAAADRSVPTAWPGPLHPDDRDAFSAKLQAHLDGTTAAVEHEHRLGTADGSYVWTLTRARVSARGEDGRPLRVVGTHIDISRRKEAEARVTHMAEHDALTDLPNRYLFRRHLRRILDRAGDRPGGQAVLACDLDRFKAVNDTLGHVAGDLLLRAAAARIRAAASGEDVVARLGGDEFAVILGAVDGRQALEAACARIVAAFERPLVVDGVAVHTGISVGAVLVLADGADADEVFKRADVALYEAKARGRSTYSLYEAEAHARATFRGLLALEMRDAIRRGDFRLVYQPIVDVATGAVSSFEALMRWHHPERGTISPGDFIPIAEETGAIVELGAWALAEACREAATWPGEVKVAVNVSPAQFRGDLGQVVSHALRASGLPPERLVVEVTEGALMGDVEKAKTVLGQLRSMGALVALDDFGTGYSSLSYLRRFPLDKLKIDRTFVRDIADPDAAAIVRAVVGIGERLGIWVVAEGVETVEQLELVRREGCRRVQGFLFSRPLPPGEARAYLASATPSTWARRRPRRAAEP